MKYLKKIFERKKSSRYFLNSKSGKRDVAFDINNGFEIQDLKDDFGAQFGISSGYHYYLKIGSMEREQEIEYRLLVPYIEEFVDRMEEKNLFPTLYGIFDTDYLRKHDDLPALPDQHTYNQIKCLSVFFNIGK